MHPHRCDWQIMLYKSNIMLATGPQICMNGSDWWRWTDKLQSNQITHSQPLSVMSETIIMKNLICELAGFSDSSAQIKHAPFITAHDLKG